MEIKNKKSTNDKLKYIIYLLTIVVIIVFITLLTITLPKYSNYLEKVRILKEISKNKRINDFKKSNSKTRLYSISESLK